MINQDFLDLFDSYPDLLKFFMFIILVGMAMGICFRLGLKDISVIAMFYAMIVICLYAFDVIPIIWAVSGYIIGIVVAYYSMKAMGGGK